MRAIKHLIWSAGAWVGLLFPGMAVSDPVTPLAVIAIDYPPYATPTREDDGKIFALLRRWAEHRKLPFTIIAEFLPPARAQNRIITGNWCASLFPPREDIEAAFVPISETTVDVGFLRLKQPEPFAWSSLDYFSGKRIAVLRNQTREGLFKPFIEKGAVLMDTESIQQGIRQLLTGRVDYAFADSTTLETAGLLQEDRALLEFSETVLTRYQYGVYLSPACKDLLTPAQTAAK